MVQRLFPVRDNPSENDRIQSRLMILAGLIIVTYAIILTLAPAVRYHAGSERYQFAHWAGVAVWVISFSLLHRQSIQKLTHHDPFILPGVALLTGIGLQTIWRLYPTLGQRQTIWLAISSAIVLLGFKFPEFLGFLRRYKYIWLVGGLVLTGLTILLGTNPNGIGSTRWFEIFGVHFQPSEPLKLLLIIYLASFFSDQQSIKLTNIKSSLPTLMVLGIALLILFFQKDLGTASILFLIYLLMLYTARGNKIVLWITPLLILGAALLGYFLLDIVQVRFNAWLNPFFDPSGASYQIIQSLIGIAEGGILGSGTGLGSPKLIPVSVSDFIFTAAAEEIGFLGTTILILLFIILLYRGTKIGIAAQTSFHRYLALGIVFYFGVQSSLIIGGNIGFLPLTGVTLPFVSYGGSSLVVSFVALLILLTISHQTPAVEEAPPIHKPRFAAASGLLIGVLVIEILVTSLIAFWLKPSLINRPENPRWIINDRFVKRGEIVDRDNQVIIHNAGETGEFVRTSNYIPLYPIVGYTNPIYGQTGIEATTFPYLRGYEGYPYSTEVWQDLVYNQPPEGLNVRLTLDLALQQNADALLAETPGSIIMMNAASGEILAMASHPYFNAESLEKEWENLVNDADAPLVNRATLGLYPPGSTLFPFILAKQVSLNPPDAEIDLDQDQLTACLASSGASVFQDRASSNACQALQRTLAQGLGFETLLDLYQSIGLTTPPALRLNVARVNLPAIAKTDSFFLGNSPFNVTPLQMALAASALTHQGILPGPRIVNAYQTPQGDWDTLPKLSSNIQALPPSASQQVTDLLRNSISPYWQMSALVSTQNNETAAWFIGGTTEDWQGQPTVVVVLLETTDPARAAQIGTTLLDQTLNLSRQP